MKSIRKVLAPTDFSRHSTYALRAAAAFARDNGASLVVLHVEPPRSDDPEPDPAAETAHRRDLGRRFDQFCEAVDLPYQRKASRGEPAAEILRVAEEMGCDLIVMGTHGRTGLSRLLAGSVAEEVLRRSAIPVLAVRSPAAAFGPEGGPHPTTAEFECGRQPSAVRTILVPVDLSRQTRRTVQTAAALARTYHAKLILLNVREWSQWIWCDRAEVVYDAEAALRVYARRRMASFSDELTGVDHEWRTAQGTPVHEILKQADAVDCDLIVMYSHGSSGLDRLIFGSVAEGVMRKATCPVLILKLPATEPRGHGAASSPQDAAASTAQVDRPPSRSIPVQG